MEVINELLSNINDALANLRLSFNTFEYLFLDFKRNDLAAIALIIF